MATKINAVITSDFGIQGQDAAVVILKALAAGEGKMLSVMVKAAKDLAGNPQASADWLAGLAAGLIKGGMTKGTAANRKSDANAIFQATYIQSQIPDAQPVKDIKGSYHDVVAKCREIVNKATGKGDGTTTSRKTGIKPISDKDVGKLVTRLTEASTTGSNALKLMVAAQSAFIKAAGTPDGLVRQCDRLAMELQKTDTDDGYYKLLGEKLSKLTQAALEHAERKQAAKDADAEKQKQILADAAKNGGEINKELAAGTPAGRQAATEQQEQEEQAATA